MFILQRSRSLKKIWMDQYSLNFLAAWTPQYSNCLIIFFFFEFWCKETLTNDSFPRNVLKSRNSYLPQNIYLLVFVETFWAFNLSTARPHKLLRTQSVLVSTGGRYTIMSNSFASLLWIFLLVIITEHISFLSMLLLSCVLKLVKIPVSPV